MAVHVFIVAGIRFSCNFDEVKSKFYRISNAIMGKFGNQRNPSVALQLISSTAIPVLIYSVEAITLNKTQRTSLEHPWDRAFMKLYGTFNKEIVKQCQYYTGFLPLSPIIDIRQADFVKNYF